jgi:pimeloyl-ACP methyl ester carboxylesterase
MTTMETKHRILETNDIGMHIAEQGTRPTVLLCHGFPECWYSWRHQLSALAEAGFHAVAPEYARLRADRRPARGREVHHVGSLVCFATKTLAKQIGDVGLVVDDQDTCTHDAASAVVAP